MLASEGCAGKAMMLFSAHFYHIHSTMGIFLSMNCILRVQLALCTAGGWPSPTKGSGGEANETGRWESNFGAGMTSGV